MTTDRHSIRQALESLVSAVEVPGLLPEEHLKALSVALDVLALSAHQIAHQFDDKTFADAPAADAAAVGNLAFSKRDLAGWLERGIRKLMAMGRAFIVKPQDLPADAGSAAH